jgi:hypothetical protein
MGHVGCEALDGVHTGREGLGHGFQRPGKVADLVLALLQIGQGDGAGTLQLHLISRRREAHHRPGDEEMQQQ